MKKIALYCVSAILLISCKQGKSSEIADIKDTTRVESAKAEEKDEVPVEYDVIDAQTFGLLGNVQSVCIQSFITNDVNGNLTEGSIVTESEMTFDQWGHVTRDEWGNEYGYDAEGHYYRGNHTYTKIKRDGTGRIKEYIDEEPNSDNEENQCISFVYDKIGRLITITQGGWTGHWQEKRLYEGGNLYPSKTITTADYEGGGESLISTTYRYSRFDEKKNWIERICVTSAMETETTDSIEGQTLINDQIRIEKRTIFYYE